MGSTPRRRRGGLAAALFSPVQQRVLGLLFGQPNRRFQSAELIRLVGSGTGAAHRVVTRLADAGLVNVTRMGNQKHYQANPASPVFAELHGLAIKTVGLVEPIRQALSKHGDGIRVALVYGSVARGTDVASSDIDLLVMSDVLAYPDVFASLQSVEALLGRPVNPTVMSVADWRKRRRQAGSLAERIVEGAHVFVIGGEDDLA